MNCNNQSSGQLERIIGLMSNRKTILQHGKQVVYYSPKREKIWDFVQAICETSVGNTDLNGVPFDEEFRIELAQLLEIVTEICVDQANSSGI